ncbi:MAG: MBL fold metallo-hydrolase [Chloroflexi bacterium]|nr:MBL fold metallo-hydrolase [Chloroflexota bacterium]
MKITHIKLSFSNAYLVTGRKTVIVDTGMPGEQDKILRAAERAGVKAEDISLILHTHGHVDHAGSSAALAKRLNLPTAVHRADEGMMQTGKMNNLNCLRLEARMILPLVNKPFPPVQPDLFVDETFNLSAFGVEGRILHTPGHTAGSVSVLLSDGAAIVGDVMMGGYMGGNLLGRRPNYHYFADDLNAVHGSIQNLLDAGVKTFYVGHGGPLERDDVARRFARIGGNRSL